jgi:hypothetical protein
MLAGRWNLLPPNPTNPTQLPQTARVSAHTVEIQAGGSKGAAGGGGSKNSTTILIKFDALVMQRQAALEGARRG